MIIRVTTSAPDAGRKEGRKEEFQVRRLADVENSGRSYPFNL